MTDYNLTEKQKELLILLVDHVREGKVREPIIPACGSGGCTVIGIKKKFDRNLIGDLDILCEVDLLGFRYNNQSNKIYTIKQAGYDAVDNNFIVPDVPAQTQINIGAIVHEVKNGNIQAVGFSSNSEVQQIVNDPLLLKESVENLTNQLLEAIKSELPAEELVAYIQNLEDLKNQLAADKPSPTKLQKLFGLLSFIGDVEGTLSLVVRAWPYIYPLLVIAAQKI